MLKTIFLNAKKIYSTQNFLQSYLKIAKTSEFKVTLDQYIFFGSYMDS